MTRVRIAVVAALFVASCARTITHPPPPVYTPPAPRAPISLDFIASRGFDATWEALVNYVSATSFAIDEFERASGLLTLSFATGDAQSAVECGTWQERGITVPYLDRNLGFALRTRSNVLVQPVGGGQTRVRINNLYELRTSTGDTYNFTTNEPATVAVSGRSVGTQRTRTCQANHAAERAFLEGVRDALR